MAELMPSRIRALARHPETTTALRADDPSPPSLHEAIAKDWTYAATAFAPYDSPGSGIDDVDPVGALQVALRLVWPRPGAVTLRSRRTCERRTTSGPDHTRASQIGSVPRCCQA